VGCRFSEDTLRQQEKLEPSRFMKLARGSKAIAVAEFAAAMAEAGVDEPFAVAVSGGPDSAALMRLARTFCLARKTPKPLILTVDHGLRPQSAAEAKRAAGWAAKLGLTARILIWKGVKPRANIQAQARRVRYALMAEAIKKAGIRVLLTGHNMDDQAETFLMRLARGSGLDGLSAMRLRSDYPVKEYDGLFVVRPLLPFSRARILATCREYKQAYISDPSNTNPVFARVRIRNIMPELEALGVTPEKIADAAKNLRRARAALEHYRVQCSERSLEFSNWGDARIDIVALRSEPEEVVLRVLSEALSAIGGGEYAAEFAELQRVYAWLSGADDNNRPRARGRTLAGCRLSLVGGHKCHLAREVSAMQREAKDLLLRPGQEAYWDGRFKVSIAANAAKGPYLVKALGSQGVKEVMRLRAQPLPKYEPKRVAATAPGVWYNGALAGCPIPIPGQKGDCQVTAVRPSNLPSSFEANNSGV
jgi:tRNA(Ile)-lysidine synthase